MSDRYILDENKKPVLCEDLHKWALWFEDYKNRRVAFFELDGVRVSTVFLGLDHGFGSGIGLDHGFGKGRPLLFETMVFDGEKETDCLRCSTWEEAEAQHSQAVDGVIAAREEGRPTSPSSSASSS